MNTDNVTTIRTRQRVRRVDLDTPASPPRRSRSTVIRTDYSTDDRLVALKNFESRQIDDPFNTIYEGLAEGTAEYNIIRPPFSYAVLMKLPQENHTLAQCIAAMVTNIEGFGYRLEYVGENEAAMSSPEALEEHKRLSAMMERPNTDYGMIELRKRCRVDLETVGDAYMEVTRDMKNRIGEVTHVPVSYMRKTSRDRAYTPIQHSFMRGGELVTTKARKRFRRYVQQVGSRVVYFKEFGDPRIIDYRNGRVTTDVRYAATEIINLSLYASGNTYGAPRWINQMPAVIGSRECELTNLAFFKDNAIPAMAVLVSGGALTEDSLSNLTTAFSSGRRGLESMNKVVVLEAVGDEDAADADGRIAPPRVEIKPLAGERQTDATFSTYDKDNHEKIRSAFRIAPLFVGRATDYTRATAEASLVVTESQVFSPERAVIDEVLNTKILLDEKGQPPKYWNVRSNPAAMASPESKLEALLTLDKLGAMTPNIAIGIANEMFGLEIATIEQPWGNLPFAMTVSKQTASQNQQDAKDVDQQIDKALKSDTTDLPDSVRAILKKAQEVVQRVSEAA